MHLYIRWAYIGEGGKLISGGLISGIISLLANRRALTALEIATHWSPMRPIIECWRPNVNSWSPVGDSRFLSSKENDLADERYDLFAQI